MMLKRMQALDTFRGRGFTRLNKREYGLAERDYSQAIELNPDYALAYGGRGYAHYYQGHEEQALADLREYSHRMGDDASPEIIRLLAQLEDTSGS